MRNLVRCLKSLLEREGAFTSKRLAKVAAIDAKMSVCGRFEGQRMMLDTRLTSEKKRHSQKD